MKRRALSLLILLAVATPSFAQDLTMHVYADERLVDAPNDPSWDDGGLGKTRYGDDLLHLHVGGAGLSIADQLSPSLVAVAEAQYQPGFHHPLSLLDAWVRYRPVSTTPWRWSLRAGALFPPVSLENDDVGWTSPWTLSPSAINTWVGEELRLIGGEFMFEHRGDNQSWDLRAALFDHDDTAGTLLYTRGWAIDDLIAGYGNQLREANAAVLERGDTPPDYDTPFRSIGDFHLGDYLALDWNGPAQTRVNLMHFDNRANPSASTSYDGDETYAWHTQFWSVGARTETGAITWIAQSMLGSTQAGDDDAALDTRFRSTFMLAGWNEGAWRPALRLDHFSTRTNSEIPDWNQNEHGNAITLALNWRPRSYLRLTAELLHIDSTSKVRAEYGLPPHEIDNQLQLNARLMY